MIQIDFYFVFPHFSRHLLHSLHITPEPSEISYVTYIPYQYSFDGVAIAGALFLFFLLFETCCFQFRPCNHAFGPHMTGTNGLAVCLYFGGPTRPSSESKAHTTSLQTLLPVFHLPPPPLRQICNTRQFPTLPYPSAPAIQPFAVDDRLVYILLHRYR